jgi:hypothetical protein
VIKSNGIALFATPPAPAEKKRAMTPTDHIIGVANLILPPHIVAKKLNTCIAEAGTAASVPIINTVFSVNDIPVAYMWCAQDENETMLNITNAKIPEDWLKIGFLENLGMISYIIPIAGITRTYTSGWNVNQNRCWYAIGSPPFDGSKNPLTPNLSVSNITSAAANVGMATITISEDVKNDQARSGTLLRGKSGCLHFRIVTIKLIEPSIDETPKIFKPKIHMSAAGPGARIEEYGGVAYHVKSAKPSQISAPAGGIIQNAIAFSFGYAMSL